MEFPPALWIAVAALMVSLGMGVMTTVSVRQRATKDYADTLAARLARVEKLLDECILARDQLTREKLELQGMIIGKGKGK